MVKKEPAKIGPSDGGAEENSGGLKGCARKFAELPDCVMKLICMVTLLLSDADLGFTYISFVSYANHGNYPGHCCAPPVPPSLTATHPRSQTRRGISRST